jgi:ubiquinone biosynthesis protein UbiJ
LAVESTQPELCLYFVCHASDLEVLSYYEGTPDCKICGTMGSLIELLWSEQDSLADSGVVLSGEIGFLLQLKKLIAHLDIDWEEPIVNVLGDTLGHTVAELMRKKCHWLQARATTLPLWIGETLTEELQASPSKTELNNFYRDVDSLRSATDRLQAHISLLKHSLQK